VVQVVNKTSPYFGVMFQIGDMQQGKAHGFYMLPGGRKEFVTVGLEECWPIGVAKIRSKEPCSYQWQQENTKPV
jgi:hypothetical protein